MRQLPVTERTTIGQLPERGTRDRDTMNAILDEGLIAHVGLSTDHGPVVIPTTYARRDDEVLIHGSPAATWLRSAGKGTPICLTVSLVDGLVLARTRSTTRSTTDPSSSSGSQNRSPTGPTGPRR